MGALFGHHDSVGWPICGAGWWPTPDICPDRGNCAWRRVPCGECGGSTAQLTALRPLRAGEVLWLRQADPALRPMVDPTHFVVTFDGSAQPRTGRAGAAAVLWGPRGDDGQRPVLRVSSQRLPDGTTSLQAEVAACLLGVAMLQGMSPQSVTIAGDNPRVMATLAGWQRMCDVVCQPLPAKAAGALRAAGWQPLWQRIGRSENEAADRAARAACFGVLAEPPPLAGSATAP